MLSVCVHVRSGVATPARREPTCLVVILAQTRSAHAVWDSFKRGLLDPLGCDLAVCVGRNLTSGPATDEYHAHAKFVWEYDEPTDYGDMFEFAARVLGAHSQEWRKVLPAPGHLFGGVLDPHHQHHGSGAVGIFVRWFLSYSLKQSGVDQLYERFVITRSDHVYAFPHPPLELLNASQLWSPTGMDFAGLNDRHLVVSRRDVHRALSLLDRVLLEPVTLLAEMNATTWVTEWNIERFLLFHLKSQGLDSRLGRFHRCMFTARSKSDVSLWSVGDYHSAMDLIVKYPDELKECEINAVSFEFFARNWTRMMQAPLH